MAACVQAGEGEVAGRLDGTDLRAVIEKLKVFHGCLLVSLLTGPLEGLGPGEVSEPVAL